MTLVLWLLIVLFFFSVVYDWLWLVVTAFVLLTLLIVSAIGQKWSS